MRNMNVRMVEQLQTSKTEYKDSMVWVMLSALVLLTFVGNWLWVNLDTRPPHWDAAAHLRIALKYLRVLTS